MLAPVLLLLCLLFAIGVVSERKELDWDLWSEEEAAWFEKSSAKDDEYSPPITSDGELDSRVSLTIGGEYRCGAQIFLFFFVANRAHWETRYLK